jgi:hypothetical protein
MCRFWVLRALVQKGSKLRCDPAHRAAKRLVNSLELPVRPVHFVTQKENGAMPNYENYFDVLSENAAPRHVVASSAVVVLMLAVALLIVSVL